MTPQQIIDQAKTKLEAAVSRLQDELNKLRTGRASASMLDGITVEAEGVFILPKWAREELAADGGAPPQYE